MQNNVFSSLSQNQDLMQINDPNVIESLIKKITKVVARRISKKTSVRQIITYPGNHMAKPVNVQHQIQKVMTQTLASANIERTLFNIETTSGPLSPRLRTKITQAIVGAFEQVYLNESSPVTDKLASIAHNIRTKHSNSSKVAYRSGKIQNIVKDSSRITKVQNLTAKKK